MKNEKIFNPTIIVEDITPKLAAEYLKHNVINRPIDKTLKKRYTNYINDGKWRVNIAEPITFADTGELVDGQHRLYAVIESGKTVRMAVVRGADKNDFAIVNTGKARTCSDVFALAGINNPMAVASTVKAYYRLKRGFSLDQETISKQNYTNEDYLNEYKTSPDLYQEAGTFGKKITVDIPITLRYAEVSGIVVFLTKEKKHDVEKAKLFFTQLTQGGEKCRAITDLRTQLQRDRISYREMRMTATTRLKYISTAWNYFAKGRDNSRLEVALDNKKLEFV